jgi:hypothetical protein
MATLETQYKDYLIEHPNSTFSFEEWKEHVLGRKLDTVLNIKLGGGYDCPQCGKYNRTSVICNHDNDFDKFINK